MSARERAARCRRRTLSSTVGRPLSARASNTSISSRRRRASTIVRPSGSARTGGFSASRRCAGLGTKAGTRRGCGAPSETGRTATRWVAAAGMPSVTGGRRASARIAACDARRSATPGPESRAGGPPGRTSAEGFGSANRAASPNNRRRNVISTFADQRPTPPSSVAGIASRGSRPPSLRLGHLGCHQQSAYLATIHDRPRRLTLSSAT
jgi:hypothetical protein